jgi:putative nucleotidyltransferase with HDIG domain
MINGIDITEVPSIWNIGRELDENKKIINALFDCLKVRDQLTAQHSLNMANYTYRLAKRFDKENASLYLVGSLVHDIGKIGMSDHVLKGSERMTPEDRVHLRQHVSDGLQLLSGFEMPRTIVNIVRFHHERYDGSGYLEGLNGDQIPLEGRIAAVADTYSALTTDRPYSRALSHNEAIEIMLKDRLKFDPTILTFLIETSIDS